MATKASSAAAACRPSANVPPVPPVPSSRIALEVRGSHTSLVRVYALVGAAAMWAIAVCERSMLCASRICCCSFRRSSRPVSSCISPVSPLPAIIRPWALLRYLAAIIMPNIVSVIVPPRASPLPWGSCRLWEGPCSWTFSSMSLLVSCFFLSALLLLAACTASVYCTPGLGI
jgi:hypothetical protein